MPKGSQVIEIGPNDFVRGMSTSSFISDGAFAPNLGGLDTAFNPQAQPGILYGPAASVDGDTGNELTDEIIASAPDHQTASIQDRVVVTAESDGTAKYYRYGTSSILGSVTATDSTNTDYQKGATDMVVYKGATFITTLTKVVKLSGASTLDTNYDTDAFAGNGLHPMVVFEDNLFYGDGNLLRRQTTVTGTIDTILTLPTGDFITALGIDRGTGRLLIATSNGLNVSNTFSKTHRLNWYDGFSNKVAKVVEVDDQIFALYSIGNTTYVGYGQNIGFLNGSGIQFLRRLRNVALVQAALPYKHNFANIGNTLYVVDGHVILAYGEILPGRKVWWQAWESPTNTRIDAIMNVGNNKLGISHATTTFTTLDVTDTSTIGLLRFVSNKLSFPSSIYIEYVTAIANNSTSGRQLFIYLAEEGYDAQNELTKEGESNLDNTSGSTIYEIYPIIGFPTLENTRSFQLEYLGSGTNWGVRRFLIYYDFVE